MIFIIVQKSVKLRDSKFGLALVIETSQLVRNYFKLNFNGLIRGKFTMTCSVFVCLDSCILFPT